jgi:hypothetical protein
MVMTPDELRARADEAQLAVAAKYGAMRNAEDAMRRASDLGKEAEIKMTRTPGGCHAAREAAQEEYRAAHQACRDAQEAWRKAQSEFAHAQVAWEWLNGQRNPPPKKLWMP